MLQIPTDEMEKILEDMKPSQLDSYLKDNCRYMVDSDRAFYHYMKDVLRRKNILLKDLYIYAGVTESYGGKIITMEKHTTDRDLILRFCIVGHFDWNECNRALKLYGFNELYAKNPRDAVIIVALNNRIFDIEEIDDLLERKGLEKISDSSEIQ